MLTQERALTLARELLHKAEHAQAEGAADGRAVVLAGMLIDELEKLESAINAMEARAPADVAPRGRIEWERQRAEEAATREAERHSRYKEQERDRIERAGREHARRLHAETERATRLDARSQIEHGAEGSPS
jgi:hypothetical protein